MKILSKPCEWCERVFEQESRRGRPYSRCEHCRKYLWYEKSKALEALYAPKED